MKTSLIFFQNEVLKNVLMEGQVDEALFHFLSEEYTWLNEYDYHPNYIIYWLFELISILGFNPLEIEQKDSRLQVLAGLKTLGKEDWLEYAFNKDERKLILQTLLTYFGEKIPNFSAFRTLEVFQVIWYD